MKSCTSPTPSGIRKAKLLFGVRPFDAPTFTLVLIVLAATAALSVVGPVFRATRIDPVGALRSD